MREKFFGKSEGFDQLDQVIEELLAKVKIVYNQKGITKLFCNYLSNFKLEIVLGIGGLTLKYVDGRFMNLVISMFNSKPNWQNQKPYCIKNEISYYCILDPETIHSLGKSDLTRFYLLIGLIKLAEVCPKNKIEIIGSDVTDPKTARILSIFYGFTLVSKNYVKISVKELQTQVPKFKKRLKDLLEKYPEFAKLDVNSFLID